MNARRRPGVSAAVAGLLLALFLQLTFAASRNSATFDEPAHIYAGYLQWDFLEKERGYVFAGTNLGKKAIFNISSGFDAQKILLGSADGSSSSRGLRRRRGRGGICFKRLFRCETSRSFRLRPGPGRFRSGRASK